VIFSRTHHAVFPETKLQILRPTLATIIIEKHEQCIKIQLITVSPASAQIMLPWLRIIVQQ